MYFCKHYLERYLLEADIQIILNLIAERRLTTFRLLIRNIQPHPESPWSGNGRNQQVIRDWKHKMHTMQLILVCQHVEFSAAQQLYQKKYVYFIQNCSIGACLLTSIYGAEVLHTYTEFTVSPSYTTDGLRRIKFLFGVLLMTQCVILLSHTRRPIILCFFLPRSCLSNRTCPRSRLL